MPITKNGNGEIVYSEKEDRWDSDSTGVFAENDFAVAHKENPVQQVKFEVVPGDTNDGVTTIQVPVLGNSTINLGDIIPSTGTPNTWGTFNSLGVLEGNPILGRPSYNGYLGLLIANNADAAGNIDNIIQASSSGNVSGYVHVFNASHSGNANGITLYSGYINGGTSQDNVQGINFAFDSAANTTGKSAFVAALGGGTCSGQSRGLDINFQDGIYDSTVGAIFNLGTGAVTTSVQGIVIGHNATSASTFTGLYINSDPAADVTNDWNGISVYGGGTATTATGLKAQMENISLSGGNIPVALELSGGKSNFTYAGTVPTSTPAYVLNNRNIQWTVPNGSPVSGTFVLANNHFDNYIFQDDMGDDGTGLKLGIAGDIHDGYIDIASGKTVDAIADITSVKTIAPGAGGGTLTNYTANRVVGVISQGGTIAVDNSYAYKVDSTFSSLSTNAYGLYLNDGNLKNFIGGKCVIGGSSYNPSGSFNNTINGTTRQRKVDTDVNITGFKAINTLNVTAASPVHVIGGDFQTTLTVDTGINNVEQIFGVSGAVNRGDGTDNGQHYGMYAMPSFIYHNSGASGFTDEAAGYDLFTQVDQGTIDNLYDFRSGSFMNGGTVNNHFGLYIYPSSTVTKKNWISEYLTVGGTGYLAPTTALTVNNDRIRIVDAHTPSSSSDTGTTGDICYDSDYIYVCIATNTWVRSALATW